MVSPVALESMAAGFDTPSKGWAPFDRGMESPVEEPLVEPEQPMEPVQSSISKWEPTAAVAGAVEVLGAGGQEPEVMIYPFMTATTAPKEPVEQPGEPGLPMQSRANLVKPAAPFSQSMDTTMVDLPPLITDGEEPSMADMALRIVLAGMMAISVCMMVVVLAFFAGGSGMAMVVTGLTLACGPGGFAATLGSHCDGIGPWTPPKLNGWLLAFILGVGIALPLLAESMAVAAAANGVKKVARAIRAQLSPVRMRRRAKAVIGTVSILVLVFFLIQGVGGTNTDKAYKLVRSGANLVPGQIGEDMRFMVDEISIGKLNQCSLPAFLNATDSMKLKAAMGDENDLDIGDSGAAVHVVINTQNAVPGSVRVNQLAVHTANGSVTPALKCDVRRTLVCSDGKQRSVLLREALVMDNCSHNLISLGKLAREEGIGMMLGACDEDSYLKLPGNITAPVLNLGIIVIPPPSANLNGVNVIARAARTTTHLKGETVHARGNHAEARTLREWHRCTSDIPVNWSKAVRDDPCESCLQGVCDGVPSDRHVREVEEPGDLVSFDVFSLGVKHVHGNQTKVFGIHDQKSKLNWVKLLKDETGPEIALALKEFHNYCTSHKVVIRHIHTDNAKAHLASETLAVIRDVIKARFTTIAPNTPRSNGAMERQWRTMASATVKMLHKSKLTRNYAWYALKQSVDVRNTLPLKGRPDDCPLSLFTGKKPSAAHFRVFGCAVYAKVFNRISKMSDQAVRCIHLGRAPNQSGYLCYDPATKRMHVSIQCKFVENALPGLTVAREGWEDFVPEFSGEYDANATAVADSEFEPVDRGSILDGVEMAPIMLDGGDDEAATANDDDTAPAARGAPETRDPGGSEFMRGLRSDIDRRHAARQPSAAMSRPLRSSNAATMRGARTQRHTASLVKAMVGVAAASMANITESFKPGGWALGAQVLGLDDTARGGFYLYLASGPEREGDFEKHMKANSKADTYVINVDVSRGGYEHDLASPTVASRLVELASKPECLGVLATIPCSTWSAARFVKPGPEPIRNLSHVSGIPDASGNVPPAAARANAIAHHCIAIAKAASSHGASYVFENPVGRHLGSQFAITGREEHASLWTLPGMAEFAGKPGNEFVYFDQCRTGAASQKTTQLLCSANIVPAIRAQVGHLVCNHPSGHPPIVGVTDGESKTKAAENFTSDLNLRLVKAFLAPPTSLTPQAGIPRASWMNMVTSAILPFTNQRTMALAMMAEDLLVDAEVDKTSVESVLEGIYARYAAIDDEMLTKSVMGVVEPMAFAVSRANRNSSDNPGFKTATRGPEAPKWWEAMESEMGNLVRNQIFTEVSEDSVPGWNKFKGRSTDVAEMLWILVKKYNELGELIKFKGRATVRGDMEPAIDARTGLTPEQTFAPTVRHNTLKLLVAAGVVRAGRAERGQRASIQSTQASIQAIEKGNKTKATMRYRTFDMTAAFLRSSMASRLRAE